MASVKKPYGKWAMHMLTGLRKRGQLKVDAFVLWLSERNIKVDRTLVSHWIAGRSHLPADVLPLLSLFTGRPDLVFGEFLREVGYDAVRLPEGAKPDKELTELMLETGVSLGHLHEAVITARTPNSPGGVKITAEERVELAEHLDELIQQLTDLKTQLENERSR